MTGGVDDNYCRILLNTTNKERLQQKENIFKKAIDSTDTMAAFQNLTLLSCLSRQCLDGQHKMLSSGM